MEKEKKDKYSNVCAENHLHFTPLVYSVDGLEGTKAKAARKRLALHLAAKWNREYSQICGFVCSRLAFTLVCATSRCLSGSQAPCQHVGSLDWLSGSGARLYNQLF